MNPWDDPRIARGTKAQLATRRARIAAGEQPLGWKVGFGAPAMMEKLGITAPLVGYLMRGALVASGATVSLTGWMQPVSEPEIAARMAKDVAAGASRDQALAAIASLTPAIEMADLDPLPTADTIAAVIAADIYQRHVVLGDTSRAGGGTAGLTARIIRRGAEVARTTEPEAATGRIVDTVLLVANTLAAFGEKLAAGDIIICGSIVPPPLLDPDETAFAYALDPVGEVSVRFSRG